MTLYLPNGYLAHAAYYKLNTTMLPALLDRLLEIANNPIVASFFGFCLGLYILRDVARIFLQLLTSFRRRLCQKDDTLR